MSESWRGKPDATKQKDLWRILNLAGYDHDDIFCDLGCGYGNLLRWSIQKVKKAIGTEDHKVRYKKAKRKIKKFSNIVILNKDYREKSTLKKLRKATIFYTTIGENLGFYHELEKVIGHKACLVTYCPPPYPIKSENFDGLYYSVRIPYSIAKNKKEWLRSITKNASLADFRKRFMIDFDNDAEEYYESLLEMNREIIGIDWIMRKRNIKRN